MMTDQDTPQTRGLDRLKQTVDDQLTSRRRFMATTAAVGGGLATASSVGAQNQNASNESNGGDQSGGEGDSAEDGPSDVDFLNFALKLEYLEARFYEALTIEEVNERAGPFIVEE